MTRLAWLLAGPCRWTCSAKLRSDRVMQLSAPPQPARDKW